MRVYRKQFASGYIFMTYNLSNEITWKINEE
jgi:hypothetical protein